MNAHYGAIADLFGIPPWDLDQRATLHHYYRLRAYIDAHAAAAAASSTE